VFRKHLLYLSNDHLTAYRWDKGRLFLVTRFENSDDGRESFSRFAAASASTPIYLLADLIEEDFVRETVPHALGKTRRGLLERKLNQHYRESAFRLATFQGRDKEGRRDDQMLFSALTNGEWVGSWVDLLTKAKAPLAGVYSPALLSANLLKKSAIAADHLLLISVHSCGLRQSYLQGAQVKFSRLTTLASQNPQDIATAVAEESKKIEQFLATSRLLPRGRTMSVVVLDHDDNLPSLARACSDTATLAFRFIDTKMVAQAAGLKAFSAEPFCDTLFLSLLAQGAPAAGYAKSEQIKFYRLWAARLGLYGASGAVLVAGLLWTASNVHDSLEFDDQKVRADLDRQRLDRQYETVTGQFPKTPTTPDNMKTAVKIYEAITQNTPMPDALLVRISRALQTVPRVQITKLKWVADAPMAGAAGDGTAPAPAAEVPPDGTTPPITSVVLGIPGKPEQQVQIDGEISPFMLDYRSVLDTLEQFKTELEKDKTVTVTLVTPPVDIRSVRKITGNTAPLGEKALFTLKLKWKPIP